MVIWYASSEDACVQHHIKCEKQLHLFSSYDRWHTTFPADSDLWRVHLFMDDFQNEQGRSDGIYFSQQGIILVLRYLKEKRDQNSISYVTGECVALFFLGPVLK